MKQRILLVEDEELIGTMVRLNLEQDGYEVVLLREGRPVVSTAQREAFDLIILDIMLPDANGVELVKNLRDAGSQSPILMLTARGDVATKVESLNRGADDYLPKPFDMPELLARCRALIRRSQGERALPSDRAIRIGQFQANLETREALTNEGAVKLSEKETNLLAYLVRNAGATMSRADILEEVWGMDSSTTDRTVDNFVMRLRKLFEEHPERPVHFVTVRSSGYRYEH